MKIAHIILANSQSGCLDKLVQKLSHPDADFYIHADARKFAADIAALQQVPVVHFAKRRIKFIKGAFSIVQATLNAFEEIITSGVQYDYINLLSGQDYPLNEASFIHQYFALHHGKQFLEYHSVYHGFQESVSHITKYHLVNYNLPGKYKLEQLVNKLMPARIMPNGLEPVGGSRWFTITMPAAKYILHYLHDHPQAVRFFKFTWAPDNYMFHTILYNSVYRRDMVNNNLRCTAPYMAPQYFTSITEDDAMPEQTDCLFTTKQGIQGDEDEEMQGTGIFSDSCLSVKYS